MFTSDHALKLDWIPNWIAIIGSGYIGLEFSDVYTALGSDVTFIEVSVWSAVFSLHARLLRVLSMDVMRNQRHGAHQAQYSRFLACNCCLP